jgi:gamma-glutamylcyclotransferase (GGCT)/AIG2-like uncharacterized protein YtfP
MDMGERRRSTGSFDARRTTGSNEALDRLFVYATLRQGQSARSLIAPQIAKSVKASTTGTIYVFPMGYAGFLEADEPMRVVGELLWLTDLAATLGLLDAYEGPDFVRVLRQVTLETGELLWSWIYALTDPEAIKHGRLIEHGDWVRYWAEQG